MERSKAERWASWIERTLITDIQSPGRPDPVPFLMEEAGELTTTAKLDSYRRGKNNGEYLYLLYLADKPVRTAADITPVYVGESQNIGSRIYQHYKKIAEALPVDEWEDDGSWGSFSKYDHIAVVRALADSPLYVWILDVDALDFCPYGFETYRQELEPKLIGLIYGQPALRSTLTNREFVPNRVLHEIGKVGADWLTLDHAEFDSLETAPRFTVDPETESKADLWTQWLKAHVYPDIYGEASNRPIPLFSTDNELQVELTERGRLKRSEAIDERIRTEGRKCVHRKGVKDDGYEGLLYLMYQLDTEREGRPQIIPRYIGKGEASGKKNELSANFVEIARERSTSRSFARWGDGDYWHVGELSMALFEDDTRKVQWASELFEQGTHQLKEQTYLWVQAWNPKEHTGPYGYATHLAEVEPQLVGVAHSAHPDSLLNKSDVPDDAPIHVHDYSFETVQR